MRTAIESRKELTITVKAVPIEVDEFDKNTMASKAAEVWSSQVRDPYDTFIENTELENWDCQDTEEGTAQ